MFSFSRNPYIAHQSEPQKQPPKTPENVLVVKPREKKEKVDPLQEQHVNQRLEVLGSLVSQKSSLRGWVGQWLLSIREQMKVREPITLSQEQLQEYSSTTLENIIKIGDKEKALAFLNAKIETTEKGLIEPNTKRKQLAILKTLQIAVGDDMFFQTVKMQASELLRNMWGDDSRNYESFIRSVRMGIEKSIHTGTVQVIKFDGMKGYEVVSLTEIRRQILEDVNNTDVGPFRSIISTGTKTLSDMLGPDAIAKIGLYLDGKYWNSRLIAGLPNKEEVNAFFKNAAKTYTNTQNGRIQEVYQTLKVDGIFEVQNIQKNFPTLLAKVWLEKLPSLRKNPPEVTELCDDLVRLSITNKQFAEYLRLFEMDSKTLEDRAKARRDELLKSKHRWDIGEFLMQIPSVDKAVARKFEGKKYPMTSMSVEQMKELFVLLAPYQEKLPKALEPKMKNIFENLKIFEDVKKVHMLRASIGATKVVTQERIVTNWIDAPAPPLTSSEKQIIESSGKLHAAREENIFIIKHTESTGALNTLLKTLWCKDIVELSSSPDKLARSIKMLSEKLARTPEEQNLLETLIGVRANNSTIQSNIAEIARQTWSPEKTVAYVTAATGENSISRKQIDTIIFREKFQSEPTATKNPEEKIYLLEPGKSISVKEFPEFRSSKVSDYIITASDDGSWNRSIKDEKGETILTDVPVMAVPSVMQELKTLNAFGFESLEKHIPLLNTIFSRKLEWYRINSYDGNFGKYEMLRLVEMLTKIVYPEEVFEDGTELKNYERFYRVKNREKSTRPEWRMKEMGILNQDGALMVEKLKEILQKIN